MAPDAPHALHMPSHIFTRVGYWQESIDSNIASARAAKADKEAADQLHAMDYEVYAYLQLGQDARAKAVIDDMMTVPVSSETFLAAAYALAASPARYAVERGDWKAAAALEVRPEHAASHHGDHVVRQRAWRGSVRRHGAGSGGDRAARRRCGISCARRRTPIGPSRSIFSRGSRPPGCNWRRGSRMRR